MPLESRSLAEVIARLEVEAPAWVRLAASRGVEGWELRVLEITTGAAPPSWQTIEWRYRQALLVAYEVGGLTLASWLRTEELEAAGERIPATFHENASVERKDSIFEGTFERLLWPFEEWRMSWRETSRNSVGHVELVADGSPSFISLDTAITALLGVRLTGWNMSGQEFVARFQDKRARFRQVVLDVAELRCELDGEQLAEATIELAGETPGRTVEIAAGQKLVAFALPDGLASGSWVLIRRGDEWLDRRFLSWPYAQQPPRGVDVVVAPETRLEALVLGGESSSVEFKRQLPSSDGDPRSVMKTVAAFANSAGGTVLFGVANDGMIVGLSSDDDRLSPEDRLANLIRDWVYPLPDFKLESLPVTDRNDLRVLALVIAAGNAKPYAAGTRPDNLVYYLRRGATTFAVMPDEVRALARGDR